MRGGDETVRLRAAHFLLVGRRLVGEVLDARQKRLPLVSVRGTVDEEGQVGNVIYLSGAVSRDGGTHVQGRAGGGERARPCPCAARRVLHGKCCGDSRILDSYLAGCAFPVKRFGLAVLPLDDERLVRIALRPRLAVGKEGERAHA